MFYKSNVEFLFVIASCSCSIKRPKNLKSILLFVNYISLFRIFEITFQHYWMFVVKISQIRLEIQNVFYNVKTRAPEVLTSESKQDNQKFVRLHCDLRILWTNLIFSNLHFDEYPLRLVHLETTKWCILLKLLSN